MSKLVKDMTIEERDKIRKKDAARYANHREVILTKRRNRYTNSSSQEQEKRKRLQQEHRKRNKRSISETKKKWYAANRDKSLAKMKIYARENREHIAQSTTERRLRDTNFKLAANLRNRISMAVRHRWKGGSAISDLGCTISELKAYLESKFYVDMAWDNWGTLWQIDHITPLASFGLSDPKQFKRAAHYSNLQPLTITDHRRKTAIENSTRR